MLHTVYILKTKYCCLVARWRCGSAYVVVAGSNPVQNFNFSSCIMYELILYDYIYSMNSMVEIYEFIQI
jgi:hypothetical protein